MFFDDHPKPVRHGEIVDACRDPRITWARKLAGEPTPCYRCIAFTGTSCALLSTTPSDILDDARHGGGPEGGSTS